jgi:hypothetical protein
MYQLLSHKNEKLNIAFFFLLFFYYYFITELRLFHLDNFNTLLLQMSQFLIHLKPSMLAQVELVIYSILTQMQEWKL